MTLSVQGVQLTPAEAYAFYVGTESVKDFVGEWGSQWTAMLDNYVEASPLCAGLTKQGKDNLFELLEEYISKNK